MELTFFFRSLTYYYVEIFRSLYYLLESLFYQTGFRYTEVYESYFWFFDIVLNLLWQLPMLLIAALPVVLCFVILPKRLLRNRKKLVPRDRALGKTEQDGMNVYLYRPYGDTGKYVKQYIIVEQEGVKYLKCKLAEWVKYIEYKIVLFGKNGKPIGYQSVYDEIFSSGYAKAVKLPKKTCFVNVMATRVDDEVIPVNEDMTVSAKNKVLFFIFGMIGAIAEALLFKASFMYVARGIYYASSATEVLMGVATAFMAATIYLLFISGVVKGKKIYKRSKK